MAKETDKLIASDGQTFVQPDTLQSIDEDAPGTYEEIKDALVDHLEEANEGDDFFLTMTLTKNLSLLPSKPEMEQVVDEATLMLSSIQGTDSTTLPTKQETTKEEKMEDYPPFSAYLILASAVCALSSIGPFLAKQLHVDATMKVSDLS